MEKVVECAAGLMDLLMLASGFQSNGLPMVWTAEDLIGAFTLASFLEKVVADWNSKEEGAMLIAALDAALTELMASCPALPPSLSESMLCHPSIALLPLLELLILKLGCADSHPGMNLAAFLPHLSSTNLITARRLLIKALVHAVGLETSSIVGLLASLASIASEGDDLWAMVIEEVSLRHHTLINMECLQSLFDMVGEKIIPEMDVKSCQETSIWTSDVDLSRTENPMSSKLSDTVTEKWAKNAMTYVMASTTVHKRASASLIFDASKVKWTEVFESLQLLPPMGTTGNVHSNITEIAELCCLHLASLNWSDLPSKILRASHVSAPSRRQLQASQVCEQGKEIQDYLMVLLNTAKVLWWKLPPVLLAAASIYRTCLFNSYLRVLAEKFTTEATICKCQCHSFSDLCEGCRKCSHSILERLWCLRLHSDVLGDMSSKHVENLWGLLSNGQVKL